MNPHIDCVLCGPREARLLATGVRDFEYGAPGKYDWLACRNCGLARIDPLPSAEVLDRAYPRDYHAYGKVSSPLVRGLYRIVRRKFARHCTAGLPTGASILDIGCSRGDQLCAIGECGDFRLFGVEYRADAAAEARARGIHVWSGEFEQADVPADSIDLAIMQHVLEHVIDPHGTMRRVWSLLKPGGRLLGELPNLASWDARLFGRYWGGGHAPRHLWFFTPGTLAKLLASGGFHEIRIRAAMHTGHWALSIQNWLRRNADTGIVGGRSWYYPMLLLAAIPLNVLQLPFVQTGVMRFEARKPGP